MNISTSLQVWISAAFTLACLSFLYKENPAFRVAENAFVGFGGAHALVAGYQNIRDGAVIPLIRKGDYLQLVPIILGLLLYARLFKNGRSLTNIPSSFLLGLGIGVTIPALAKTQVIDQMAQLIRVPKTANDFIILFGGLLTLLYFVFTMGHNRVMGRVSRLGRAFIMLAFGAQFGNYVMGRAATFIGRLYFLLSDWLGIIKA